MLNADRYSVSNASLIGRLLPFFARGRKLSMFLYGIMLPIEHIHDAFKEWALKRIVESVATSQPIIFRWYLKKMMGQYIENKNDEFSFGYSVQDGYLKVYEDEAELTSHLPSDNFWMFEDNDDMENMLEQEITDLDEEHCFVAYNAEEVIETDGSGNLSIYAPKQVSTCESEDYVRMIRQCVAKYLIYDMEYNVRILN